MKRVSVIMPCYNDGKFIMDSINSVLNQSYGNIEIIIVDDGSDDQYTKNILAQIVNDRIILCKTKHIGPSEARNFGIINSSGYYILPLDSDDIICKDYIKKAVDIIDSDDNIGAVYCKAKLFGKENGSWDLPNYSFEQMLLDNVVFVSSLFRKEDWEKIGGFNKNMVYGMEDYDFWLSILEMGKIIYQIPEVLFYYRIKSESRTTNFIDDIQKVKETYMNIYLNHENFYMKYHREYSKVLRNALIEQIFINKQMRKQISIFEKLSKNIFFKRIINRFILKRG